MGEIVGPVVVSIAGLTDAERAGHGYQDGIQRTDQPYQDTEQAQTR